MNAVDIFCGAGGWSHGWRLATGTEPLVGVNHCAHAVHLHRLNHPTTEHHVKDVWEVDPAKAIAGRRVDWLHGSPDCTHHSRAKGRKPREQKIRALADVLIDWAKVALPRIFSLENVAEWLDWGPLDEHQHPIKTRKGELFREWLAKLRALGYVVDWRVLCAADYGAPTIRKRLFLLARRDGKPIVWPEPTHADPKKRDLFNGALQPWRTAASCIDWSIPCPSIFGRKRELAAATKRRIAAGIVRYVLKGKPFLVCLTHGGRLEPVDQPLRTITTANGGERALVAPTLIQTGYGERQGQDPRALDLQAPLGTVVAGGSKHALVAAFLQQNFTGMVGKTMRVPVPTITARDHHSLVAAHLTVFRENNRGRDVAEPMPTITSGAGSVRPAGAAHATGVVAATLLANNTNNAPGRADAPLGTVTTGDRHFLVASFLTQYYGSGGQHSRADAPLPAVVTRARHGLVTVTIAGVDYAIVDIGLRMLEPRELARAQGFPDTYHLAGTKAQQIARIGNSVCPDLAAAIVRANLGREAAVA